MVVIHLMSKEDYDPENEKPNPHPRCYGNFGTILCHKGRGGMCGPYAETCEIYTEKHPSKYELQSPLGKAIKDE